MLFGLRRHDAADMERTHRQLRARFADTLSGDDSDGHAFFDHRPGRHIHPVAQAANTQRCIASHRTADLDFLQAHHFDLASDFRSDHLILFDDHFVGHRIDDVLAADATVDRSRPSELRLVRRDR